MRSGKGRRTRIIEAVARFDAEYSTDYPGRSMEATLRLRTSLAGA